MGSILILAEVRQRLAEPVTRTRALVEVGDWARDLCLTMGASLETAYFVGGALARGVERSWSEEQTNADAETPLPGQLARRRPRAQRKRGLDVPGV